MRFLQILLSSLTIGTVTFCQEPDDLKRVQGIWILVRIEANGIQVFPQPKKKRTPQTIPAKIAGDKLYLKDDLEGTITLDPKKTPKQINLGPERGHLFEGIYKIEDGELWLCWADGKDAKRPKQFKTDRDIGGARIWVLKRPPRAMK